MNWKPLLVILVLVLLWDVFVPLLGVGQMLPWELKKRIESGDPPIMLDVRSPQEFSWFHIPHSVNRPFPPDPDHLGIAPDAEIVLVCMTGHRSPVAGYQLRQAGFTNVHNLTWGAAMYALLGGRVVTGR